MSNTCLIPSIDEFEVRLPVTYTRELLQHDEILITILQCRLDGGSLTVVIPCADLQVRKPCSLGSVELTQEEGTVFPVVCGVAIACGRIQIASANLRKLFVKAFYRCVKI